MRNLSAFGDITEHGEDSLFGTHNASSWAFRACLALREADIEFDEEVVDIRQPQCLDNLARIQRFSPPGAVPVLVDDGVVIFGALVIMEYADELSGGSEAPAQKRMTAFGAGRSPRRRAGSAGSIGCQRSLPNRSSES